MQHQHQETYGRTPAGATVLELLILGGVVFLLVVGMQIFSMRSEAARRDLERLATLRVAQAAFAQMYLQSGSYAQPSDGCASVGAPLSSCDFAKADVASSSLRDPGKLSLTLATAPTSETYGIHFTLEQRHGALAAGDHILGPAGIQ